MKKHRRSSHQKYQEKKTKSFPQGHSRHIAKTNNHPSGKQQEKAEPIVTSEITIGTIQNTEVTTNQIIELVSDARTFFAEAELSLSEANAALNEIESLLGNEGKSDDEYAEAVGVIALEEEEMADE